MQSLAGKSYSYGVRAYIFVLTTILALIPLVSVDCSADQVAILGRAPFAITHPNFNCKAYQESTAGLDRYAIALLWNTFGSHYDCLDSELQNQRVALVEVHLINGACIRNRRCGSYEFLAKYTVETLRAAARAKSQKLRVEIEAAARNLASYLLPKLSNEKECYINPILETNLGRDESVIIQEWIRPIFQGRCKFVWNPVGSDPGSPIEGAAVSEGHGATPNFIDNRCIANPDGTTISSESWLKFFSRYRQCVAVLAWSSNDNCNVANAPFKDPRKRGCTITDDYIGIKNGLRAAKNSWR